MKIWLAASVIMSLLSFVSMVIYVGLIDLIKSDFYIWWKVSVIASICGVVGFGFFAITTIVMDICK